MKSKENLKDVFLKEMKRKEKQYINRLTIKNKDICELREQLENASKNYTKCIQQRDNVLDEIREYIVDDIQHCTYGQVPKYQDILQILDKVGKE